MLQLRLLIFLLFLSVSLAAQAVCPVKQLTINTLSGRVVWNDAGVEPIARTRVELFDTAGDEQRLIETVKTDDYGKFAFNSFRKGKYAIQAFLEPNDNSLGPSYWIPVKLDPRRSSKKSIMVLLGLDCWKSEARTENVAQ